MDERKKELKNLKKAYKRARRRSISIWKALTVLAFLGGAVCAALGFVPALTVQAAEYIGWELVLPGEPALICMYQILTVVAGLVFVISVIMWIAGRRKLRKNDEYLSYRTLKEALRAEKKLAS